MFENKACDPNLCNTEVTIDEFLEEMWLAEESGGKAEKAAMFVDAGLAKDTERANAILHQMKKDGFVSLHDGKDADFTDKGRERAKKLIRRKRLAEKLLAEVFALGADEIKTTACQFEHILSPEVTDSVCSFLGHPPTCPHGKHIPQGDCCNKLAQQMKPLVTPLTDLQPGNRAKIVFIAPKDHSRMDRLSTLGIVPGTIIHLHQKKPALVIRSGETELALDIEIANEIYVKIME